MRIAPIVFAFVLALAGCDTAAPQGERGAPPSGPPPSGPWEQVLAEQGLTAAEAVLAGAEESGETAFLLGGVRFLKAVEHILQVRYASYQGTLPFLPGMRTPLPANPDPVFDPAFLETAMAGALDHLAGAATALAPAVTASLRPTCRWRRSGSTWMATASGAPMRACCR